MKNIIGLLVMLGVGYGLYSYWEKQNGPIKPSTMDSTKIPSHLSFSDVCSTESALLCKSGTKMEEAIECWGKILSYSGTKPECAELLRWIVRSAITDTDEVIRLTNARVKVAAEAAKKNVR